MKIDRIVVHHVAMPLKSPWRTAYGEDHVIESVLVQLTSGALSAWGESCPLRSPTYSSEHAAGVYSTVVQHMAPLLLGKQISHGEDLQRLLCSFKGNPFAKAALDTAWWALHSRMTRLSLSELLGASRTEVAVGADFGVQDSIEQLLDKIDNALKTGFSRVKLKIKPGWDSDVLQAVRARFPPPTVFHVDCNAGYSLERDRAFLLSLDDYKLAMIEQPLSQDDGLVEHAELQRLLRTPICLDESLSSYDRACRAIQYGSCRVFNIKPGRCGGITVAKQIMDLAQAHGVQCWVGGMLESAVGSGLCIGLAMLDVCSYPADIFASETFYSKDMSRPPISTPLRDGVRVVQEPPGPFQVEPDWVMLEACTLARWTSDVP